MPVSQLPLKSKDILTNTKDEVENEPCDSTERVGTAGV